MLITRQQGVVEYLEELGIKPEKVLPHATLEDVREKDVMGELPFSLAAEARTVTVVTLDPSPASGEDLSKEEVARRFQGLETYVVLSDVRVDQVRDEMLAYAAQHAPLVSEEEVATATYRTLYKESWSNPIAVAAHPDLAPLLEEISGKEPRVGPVEERQVAGRQVYGAIPLHLAERATSVTVPEESQGGVQWKDYTVYTEAEYLYRTRLIQQQIDVLQQIKEQGLFHDQTERILDQAREVALENRAEIYFYRGERQVVVTPDPLDDPYLHLPADRRMYLIENLDSKLPALQTLVHEGGRWGLRSSGHEATWAPVIRSLEELERITEGRFEHPRGWTVPDEPHYTLESRPGVVFVQEGNSWKALPDYRLFAKDAMPAPRELEWQLKYVDQTPEFDRPTFRQWNAAYNLARAHEHEWTNLSQRELYDTLDASPTNREMETRVRSARWELCGPFGGTFPEGRVERGRSPVGTGCAGAPGGKYVLSHTTGTGRLTWEVDPEGNLHLEVRRPSHHPGGPEALHSEGGYAVLIAEYDSSTRQWKMREVYNDDALPRHVEVLIQAANATERTLPAELREELRARARENEARHTERNLEALERRFGEVVLSYLSEALQRDLVSFDPHSRNFEVSQPMQRALGEDLVEAVRAAYADTPAIAERLRERSREVSPER